MKKDSIAVFKSFNKEKLQNVLVRTNFIRGWDLVDKAYKE